MHQVRAEDQLHGLGNLYMNIKDLQYFNVNKGGMESARRSTEHKTDGSGGIESITNMGGEPVIIVGKGHFMGKSYYSPEIGKAIGRVGEVPFQGVTEK